MTNSTKSPSELDAGDLDAEPSLWGLFALVGALICTITVCSLSENYSWFLVRLFVFTLAICICVIVGVTVFRRLWCLLLLPLGYCAFLTITSDFATTTTRTIHVRTGAITRDGSYTSATGSGAGSWHGGVKQWLTEPIPVPLTNSERWHKVLWNRWYLVVFLGSIPAILIQQIAFCFKPPKGAHDCGTQ